MSIVPGRAWGRSLPQACPLEDCQDRRQSSDDRWRASAADVISAETSFRPGQNSRQQSRTRYWPFSESLLGLRSTRKHSKSGLIGGASGNSEPGKDLKGTRLLSTAHRKPTGTMLGYTYGDGMAMRQPCHLRDLTERLVIPVRTEPHIEPSAGRWSLRVFERAIWMVRCIIQHSRRLSMYSCPLCRFKR